MVLVFAFVIIFALLLLSTFLKQVDVGSKHSESYKIISSSSLPSSCSHRILKAAGICFFSLASFLEVV
jgi:amino acid permease